VDTDAAIDCRLVLGLGTSTGVPFSRDSDSPLDDSDLHSDSRVKDSDFGHAQTR
jgi:hypothetical protein